MDNSRKNLRKYLQDNNNDLFEQDIHSQNQYEATIADYDEFDEDLSYAQNSIDSDEENVDLLYEDFDEYADTYDNENLSEINNSEDENYTKPTNKTSRKLTQKLQQYKESAESIPTETKAKPEKPTSQIEAWELFEQGQKMWADFNHRERENVVKHYAPKIRFIALRMKAKLPKHIDLNELVSSGTIGLLEALGKFKPQLNIRFDSYAESRIRGAMIDELRKLDWFPRSLRARVREIDQAMWRLENEKGRLPTTQEIAEHIGISEKEVDIGLEALQNQLCVSLDAIQDSVAKDGRSSNDDDPYQSTAFLELVDKVSSVIEILTPREKLVLSLYYNEELNMREASEVMEITEGRVSQLHSQAISRLRKIFAERFNDSL